SVQPTISQRIGDQALHLERCAQSVRLAHGRRFRPPLPPSGYIFHASRIQTRISPSPRLFQRQYGTALIVAVDELGSCVEYSSSLGAPTRCAAPSITTAPPSICGSNRAVSGAVLGSRNSPSCAPLSTCSTQYTSGPRCSATHPASWCTDGCARIRCTVIGKSRVTTSFACHFRASCRQPSRLWRPICTAVPLTFAVGASH